MKKILTLLFLCAITQGYAQSIFNMPSGNNGGNGTSFVTCSGSFNDDGQQNNYGNNQNGLATFCPGISTDRMELNFLQVAILAGDVLTIFDGSTAAAPVLGTITNTTTPAGLFRASAANPTGCLTVRFVSNATGNAAGWRAQINCFNPCQSITPNIVTTPATDADNVLRICQGQTVSFNGTANFSVSGAGATYEWDLGNGGGVISGQTATETYSAPGVYFVRFEVTDALGCFDRDIIDLTVQVSTDPDFTGTAATDPVICFGESTTITGVATPQQFALSPSPPIAGRTFLPDGSGVSYQTCIDVDLFAPGATVQSAADILNIFVNMEHSFLGDLNLSVTAPNGATVALHTFPSGGGTFLGVPIDDDAILDPGSGFEYVFTEAPIATRTWAQWVTQVGGSTVPAGNYRPVDPYSRFIGSPLNGLWCINIIDNLQSDNGYIFSWGLNFNPAIIPPALSFTPGVATEQWLPDPSITNTAGNVITVQPATAGQHCFNYEFVDSFGCAYMEQVCITVQPEITSSTPPDIFLCALPGSGTNTFDLTQNEALTLNGLDPSLFTLQYYTSLANAQAGTNPIANPSAFTSTSNPQIIFVAVIDDVTMCAEIHEFTISSVDFGSIVIPDFVQCGTIFNFDIVSYVAPFLSSLSGGSGGGSGTNGFTISYHTTLVDAQTGNNPISNPSSYTPGVSPQTIFIRIVSDADSGCFSIQPFDLIGLPIPTASQPANIMVCDDATNDGTADFVLSTQDAAILNGQSSTLFNVTYYTSQSDADAASNAISSSSYRNTSRLETIFARVDNNPSNGCFNTTSFTIQVDEQAVYNMVNNIEQCDDATNDGVAIFDLTTQTATILGTQNPANFTVSYHTSLADASANTSPIMNPANYTNTSRTQIIYARVTPSGNAVCAATGSFLITVVELPVANPATNIVLCDDATNDGVEVFDLSTSLAQVLGTQDPAGFTVTFHESQANADAGTNPVATNYLNTSANQLLFARIENNLNPTCFDTTSLNIMLNEAPRIATPANLLLCDDLSGDGTERFDLSLNDSTILNGLNPADYVITYHLSQVNANIGMGLIASNYSNISNPETIYVRVVNTTTGCVNTTSFDIIVSPIPAITSVPALEECDADLDGVAVFNLTDRSSQIINGLNNHSVLFYASNADAIAGLNSLNATSYSNTSNPQTISYRLIDNTTGCFAIGDFNIEAVTAPIITAPLAAENCDDGTGTAFVDLDSISPQIIGTQMGLTVTYHLTQADATNLTNALPAIYDYNATDQLFVRVQDNSSGCTSFTTLDIIFNDLPQPILLDEYILCIDNGVLLFGPAILNTGLDNATYDFIWTLDAVIIPGATQAIFNATVAGNYEVTATNRTTGCMSATSTFVRQSGAPQIFDVRVTTNPFSFQHQVIATASGPDTYWFSLDDGPFVNSGIFDDVAPGPHTVTIAERNGCGDVVVDVFVFGYPDYFTPNNDGFHDTWNIVGGDRLPGTILYIFDRYGKLLKQLDPSGAGWDGTYNGQPLPSSDYWFKIEYQFGDVRAEASGHFAMKR